MQSSQLSVVSRVFQYTDNSDGRESATGAPRVLLALLALGLSCDLHAGISYTGSVTGAGTQNSALWNLGGTALDIGNSATPGVVTVTSPGVIRLSSSGSINLARQAGSSGTLTLSGQGAQVNGGQNIDVGDIGIGVLRISSGAQVSTGQGYIGRLANSQGEALITGKGSKLSTSSFLFIGNFGDAQLTVADGGEVSASGIIDIGRNASNTPGAPTDIAFVTDAGSLISSNASINVGRNATGKLTVTKHAQAISLEGYLGREALGNGTVDITAAGQWQVSGQLVVGNSGTGALNLASAGQVRSVNGYLGRLAGANGQATITDTGSHWSITDTLVIGGLGRADLTLASGGQVSATSAVISQGAGSSASVILNDSGTRLNVSDALVVGGLGDANMLVNAGGQVSSASAVVGQGAGSNGRSTLSGAGANWINTGAVLVGDQGSGTLTLEQGAELSAASLTLAAQAGSSAALRVASGALLEVSQIKQGAGAPATVTFDGGILRATGDQADFLSGVTTALLDASGLSVDTHGYTLGVNAHFSGAGGISKQGSGTLNLMASSSYGGPTQINQGLLNALADNALGSGGAVSIAGGGSPAELHLRNVSLNNTINIGSQGQLFGIGSVGSTVVQNGAIIAPGFGDSQIGTLSINGDLTFAPGSEYDVFLDKETGASDRLIITGLADLSGGQLRYKGVGETYERGAWYEILRAGTRVGRFAEVESDYAFLQVITDYDLDPNKVFIGLRRKVGITFSDLAYTPNQKATARALEQIDDADLLDEFIETLPNGEPARMYDFLSGEIHASLRSSLQSWDALASQASVQPLQQALAQAACQPPHQSEALWAQYHCASTQGWPVWVQTLGNWQHRRSDGNAAKGQSHAGGVLIGTGAELGQSGWHLGASVGYGHTDLSVKARHSTAKIDHYSAALFTGKSFAVGQNQLKLSGILHYGHHQIKTERFVPRIEQQLKAGYHGHNLQLSAEASYAFAALQSWQMEPYLRLAVDRQRLGSFREKGGFSGVNADSSSRSHSHSQLGARAAYRYSFAGRPVEVSADLGWKRSWNHRDVTRTMAFNVGSPEFSIAGVDLPRDALVANLRGQWAISEQAVVELNIAGEFASHLKQQSASLGLRYAF